MVPQMILDAMVQLYSSSSGTKSCYLLIKLPTNISDTPGLTSINSYSLSLCCSPITDIVAVGSCYCSSVALSCYYGYTVEIKLDWHMSVFLPWVHSGVVWRSTWAVVHLCPILKLLFNHAANRWLQCDFQVCFYVNIPLWFLLFSSLLFYNPVKPATTRTEKFTIHVNCGLIQILNNVRMW